MLDLASLLRGHARRAARRVAIPAAFAIVTLVFVSLAITALFAALFFMLEPSQGPLRAALILSASALVLAALASTPLWFPRRKPPPAREPTLAEFVALMAKSAPTLAPRQLALTAVLLALALALMAKPTPVETK